MAQSAKPPTFTGDEQAAIAAAIAEATGQLGERLTRLEGLLDLAGDPDALSDRVEALEAALAGIPPAATINGLAVRVQATEARLSAIDQLQTAVVSLAGELGGMREAFANSPQERLQSLVQELDRGLGRIDTHHSVLGWLLGPDGWLRQYFRSHFEAAQPPPPAPAPLPPPPPPPPAPSLILPALSEFGR